MKSLSAFKMMYSRRGQARGVETRQEVSGTVPISKAKA